MEKKTTKKAVAHAAATLPPSRENRENLVTIRLNPAEYGMLTEMAAHDGISLSDALRISLRRQYNRFVKAEK